MLFMAPDTLAEALLLRLSRIGYPDGGVIRYIESNPALGERAIGTWVDPNALGGILATAAIIIAPQIASKKPVIPWRWLTPCNISSGHFGAILDRISRVFPVADSRSRDDCYFALPTVDADTRAFYDAFPGLAADTRLY